MSNVNDYVPATTGYARVFYIEGRARGDHAPQYASQLKMTGISQNFGDITKVEIPDPDNYNKFKEVATIRGATERATTSLQGRYAAAVKSALLKMARKQCPIDVQLHMGQCDAPNNFNKYTKALILENVSISSYSTDDMVALESGENNPVNETAEISAGDVYEVVPLTMTTKATDILTNKVVGIAVVDNLACAGSDCASESDGCQEIYAATLGGGGSVSTPGDIVFSLDGGVTWKAHDIDSAAAGDNPTDVAGVGDYIVVTVAGANSEVHIALLSEFENSGDPDFTEVTTGFVASKGPNAIWSLGRKAFLVGQGGYVYFMEDPADGVTVLDAGVAVVDNLLDVHAISEFYAIAGGGGGSIIHTTDGSSWAESTSTPVGVAVSINAVWMKNKNEWWVGCSNGKVYYTVDAGVSWTESTIPGTAPSSITDIAFVTPSVGYLAATVNSHGKLYRTIDGGYTWVAMPEASGSMPLCDTIEAIAVCKYEPDFLASGGLADDGSDGLIVMAGE